MYVMANDQVAARDPMTLRVNTVYSVLFGANLNKWKLHVVSIYERHCQVQYTLLKIKALNVQ